MPIAEEKWCMCGCHNRGGVVGCGICGHWKARPDAVSGIEDKPPPWPMCGRPIREEKPDTIISIDMTGVKFPVQEPSEGEEITRVKRLYRGVINLDVEPNRYEFPNYEAADAALDKLLHSERTKIVGEIKEKMPKESSGIYAFGWNEYRAAILKVLEDYNQP